jgi:hypothetical protein
MTGTPAYQDPRYPDMTVAELRQYADGYVAHGRHLYRMTKRQLIVGLYENDSLYCDSPEERAEALAALRAYLGLSAGEFTGYTTHSLRGVLHILSLPDRHLLEAARDRNSVAWRKIHEFMGATGTRPATVNPSWITAQCAKAAHIRKLITTEELDRVLED